VFVSWIGDQIPFMKRAPTKAAQTALKEKLRPYNLSLTFHHREDLELDAVCKQVQGVVYSEDSSKDSYSAEAVRAALEDEETGQADDSTEATVNAVKETIAAERAKALQEVKNEVMAGIKLVRSGSSKCTWALMVPKFS